MKRLLTIGVTFLYFCANVALADAVQSNIWAERRSRAQSVASLASLPSAPAGMSAVLNAALPSGRAFDPSSRFVSAGSPRSARLSEILASIPAASANVRRIVPANAGRASRGAVIIVQDVHLNREAQENIARTLEAMSTAGPVTVGVEGAFGAFDFTRFSGLPDRAITSAVARYFLAAGRIAAPSLLGISGHGPSFFGVDDGALYARNLAAVRDAGVARASANETIEAALSGLSERKRRVLNPDIRRLDDLRVGYRSGSVSMGPYVERLVPMAGGPVPAQVRSYLDAFTIEKSIDYGRVERERRLVVERLVAAAKPAELKALMEQTVRYRSGQLGYAEFYGALTVLARRNGVSLDGFPSFSSYLRYVLLAESIRAEELFAGVSELESRAIARLSRSIDERQLLLRDESARLAAGLVAFALTPDEWRRYRDLRNLSPLDSRTAAPFESFYEAADERSRKIVENVLALPGASGVRGLVAGGFHTPEIAERLANAGADVAILQPVLTSVEGVSGTEYLSIFTREKAPLDRLVTGEKLFLAPSQLAAGNTGNSEAEAASTLLIHHALAQAALAGKAGDFPSGSSSLRGDGASAIVTTRAGGVELTSTPGRGSPAGFQAVADGMPAPDPALGLRQLTFLSRTPSVLARVSSALRRLRTAIQPPGETAPAVLPESAALGERYFSSTGRLLPHLTALVVAPFRELLAVFHDDFVERHGGTSAQRARRTFGQRIIVEASFAGVMLGFMGGMALILFFSPSAGSSLASMIASAARTLFIVTASTTAGFVALNAGTHSLYNLLNPNARLVLPGETARTPEAEAILASETGVHRARVLNLVRHHVANLANGAIGMLQLFEEGEEHAAENLGYARETAPTADSLLAFLEHLNPDSEEPSRLFLVERADRDFYATRDTMVLGADIPEGAPFITVRDIADTTDIRSLYVPFRAMAANVARLVAEIIARDGRMSPSEAREAREMASLYLARFQAVLDDYETETRRVQLEEGRREAASVSRGAIIRRIDRLARHRLNNTLVSLSAPVEILAAGPENAAQNASFVEMFVSSLDRLDAISAAFDPAINKDMTFYLTREGTDELYATLDTPGYGQGNLTAAHRITGADLAALVDLATLSAEIKELVRSARSLGDDLRARNGVFTADELVVFRQRGSGLVEMFRRITANLNTRADYADYVAAGGEISAELVEERSRFALYLQHEGGNRLSNFSGRLENFGTRSDESPASQLSRAREMMDRFAAFVSHLSPGPENTVPFARVDQDPFEIYATPDTAIFGALISPESATEPGHQVVKRVGATQVHTDFMNLVSRARGTLADLDRPLPPSPVQLAAAKAQAAKLNASLAESIHRYAEFTRLMADDVRRSARPPAPLRPAVTFEVDAAAIDASTIPQHRERLLSLVALEVGRAETMIRDGASALAAGGANVPALNGMSAGVDSVRALLSALDPDAKAPIDLFLVRQGDLELYVRRGTPGFGDLVPADLAAKVTHWRLLETTDLERLHGELTAALAALDDSIRGARDAGDLDADAVNRLRRSVDDFLQRFVTALRNDRVKTETIRRIQPLASAVNRFDMTESLVETKVWKYNEYQRRLNRIVDATVYGAVRTDRGRANLAEALNSYGFKFDEDDASFEELEAAARRLVSDLSIQMSEEETREIHNIVANIHDTSVNAEQVEWIAEGFGWRILPVIEGVQRSLTDPSRTRLLKVLAAAIESGVSAPADMDRAVARVINVVRASRVSFHNVFEDMGRALGTVGAPVIRYVAAHPDEWTGTGWRLLAAAAVGGAIDVELSAPGRTGNIIERLEAMGATADVIRMATALGSVDLFNDGGANLGAPAVFRGMTGRSEPLGSRPSADMNFDATRSEPIGSLPLVPVVDFLEANGITLAENRSMPEPALVLGRTVYFTRSDGRLLALKFMRDDGRETPNELLHESRVQSFLARNRDEMDLQSDYPEAVAIDAATDARVGRATDIPPALEEALRGSAVPVHESRTFFAYVADRSYTVYSHQVSNDADFSDATARSLHDLAVQARNGIVHETVFDATHTSGREDSRADHGVFYWNVDVIPIRQVGVGTGRLHNPWSVLQYTNLRASGLSDLGDMRAYRPRSDTFSPAANFTYYLGSYLLAASLLKGYQMQNSGRLRDWRNEDEVESLAEWHLDQFARYAQAYTSLPLEQVRAYLAGAVDWKALARQMIFFMGKGADGRFHYAKHLFREEPFPAEIFPGSEVNLPKGDLPTEIIDDNRSQWRMVIPGQGWGDLVRNPDGSTDIRAHRGAVNGPFDIQELIRAIYVTTGLMATQARATDESPAAGSLILPENASRALGFFLWTGLLGRASEWKIALFAAVVETFRTFTRSFILDHPSYSPAQTRARVIGLSLIHAGALFSVVAFAAVAGMDFSTAAGAMGTIAGFATSLLAGNVATHAAWNLGLLLSGRSLLTPDQRAALRLVRARNELNASERRTVDDLISALPEIGSLGVARGMDLRAQAGRFLIDQLSQGRPASQALPELSALAGAPEGSVRRYEDVVEPAASAGDATVTVRVMPFGLSADDLQVEARKELKRRAETGASDTVVFAVTGGDAAARGALALDGRFGSAVRFVPNDDSLVFEPETLRARLELAALKKINVFISQNAALSPAALESLRELERIDPRLASIYLLIESATRVTVAVSTEQIGEMIRLRRLVETQA